MKSSLRIARVFGIPVEIHWTFLLLLVWVFFAGGGQLDQWREILIWLLTVIALFGCVVLHEFGHALMARRFGIKTRDIILSPIGGVARLEGLPEKPLQEFWVAIAGPLVNVGIILVLIPLQLLFPSTLDRFLGLFSEESNTFLWEMFQLEYMVPFLISINIMLVIFNLLPAFPMDGGRVLRALLAMRTSRVNATRWAARIGQTFAVALFAWGLFQFNLVLAFIGLFVFMAAGAEFRYVRTDHLLTSLRLRDIVSPNFTIFHPEDPIYSAAEALQSREGPHFPVVDQGGELVGILHEQDVRETVADRPLYPVRIGDKMRTPSTNLTLDMNLKEAYTCLDRTNPVLPVYGEGKLAGLVSLDQVHQVMRGRTQGK